MSDQLTKAFKELLNQERFASQSEIPYGAIHSHTDLYSSD